ncbi:MAG: hypothetical protein JW818_05300 [Pirellulales bacterium]|nr:hypothetical protein [Pirellulales bacterium]
MGGGWLDQIIRWIGAHPAVMLGAALAVAGLFLVWLVRRWIRGRGHGQAVGTASLVIDVATLPQVGPPPGPPTLEFYNLPVRLAAIVLAPVGRVHDLPTREDLPDVIDAIVPGLDDVAAAHQPLFRPWPRQVSARGFAHAFFANVRLPGRRGMKTPWSLVAGVFRINDRPMMAGLILRSDLPNRHEHYVISQEDQWLGILRVRLHDR